jgi:ADP-dependent NAD(P)H-hydrate dehydratase / NAD(P)H-hydrate epimerase
MEATYWLKQSADKPLFEDLLWSRPENKQAAGKLLIIGGNSFGFAAVGEAYQQATKAGIGSARVLLPQAIKKVVGPILMNGEFAPSTPSGSFSQKALDTWLELAAWSDGVLLAGDIGRNSETAILLEKFLHKFSGQVTITKDAIEYATSAPQLIANRQNTCVVLSISQLQRLFTALKSPRHIALGMGLPRLVDALNDFSQTHPFHIVTKHLENIVVAVNGHISTTKLAEDKELWRVSTAAHSAVWWLQNPTKPFEAISTAGLAQGDIDD